jgi:hypothetical protein
MTKEVAPINVPREKDILDFFFFAFEFAKKYRDCSCHDGLLIVLWSCWGSWPESHG